MATEAQLAEKALQDRLGVRTPSPATLEPPRRGRPPPLPPRENSISSPPAYSAEDAKRSEMISEAWRSHDPRSSSTHSLVPSESGRGRDGRRKLLAIFIHGFMGNESSFQSFPAHLHNLLTVALSETHVVHTKIYPRYKSRRAIDFARDDFGTWLEPHEDDATDVILLGHSMGGILSAEVALQPPPSPATGLPFAHRILGTISFDTPFLGMHPGVIASGIGSLFRPAPDPQGSKPAQATSSGASSPSLETQVSASMYSQGTSTPTTYGGDSETSSQISRLTALSNPPPDDPNFNPAFSNDVRLPERKGLNSVLHFINKHAEGLTTADKFAALTGATKSYFMSHLEFGGCLADYPGLKARYTKLRALEDVDDTVQRPNSGYRPPTRRIRFVNYYTASTGRPKEPKIPPGQMMDEDGNLKPMEEEIKDMSLETANSHTPTPNPSISIEQVDGDSDATPERIENAVNDAPLKIQMQDLGDNSGVHDEFQEPAPMRHIDSLPIEENEEEAAVLPSIEPAADETSAPKPEPMPTEPPLPPIPEKPTEPEPIDLTIYTDKDSRKIAEKEFKRLTKAYQQAIKDRESAIKDRRKLVEKREKKARQETEKQLKAEQKQRTKEEKEEAKRLATINPEPVPSATSPSGTRAGSVSVQDDKRKRDKKFCMLPPQTNGKRDKCWVRVYMEGVDEVGAHCGLFFPGPQYESLVGNVGERIEEWVKEDGVKRALSDTHWRTP